MKEESRRNGSIIEFKDLESIWLTLSKNFFVLILIPLIAFVIGYIYTYRLPEKYGAKIQLLLKSNETYDYQDPIYKGLGAYGMYMDVSNQIRILQSKDLIGEVIDKMNIDVSYFVVGRLKKKEVFGTLPYDVDFELINGSVYEVPIQTKILDENNYELIYEVNGIEKKIRHEFDRELINEDFKISLTKNYPFTKDNIGVITDTEYEILLHSKDYLVNSYQRKMSITNIDYTSILDVSVEDDIAERAKVFLDTLSEVFINFSKRSQLEVNQNTLDNIEKQITEVQKIILDIEDALILYKEKNDILDLTREESEYFSKYVSYSQEKRDLAARSSSILALENYILTSPDEHILPPSFYVLESDLYLSERVNQMYTKQIDLMGKIYSFSPDHPSIAKMKEELNIMKKDLLIYIKNLKSALKIKINEVDIILAEYKDEIQGLPRSMQGVDNIERELEVNNKMYLFLLEKKTNTLIARAGIIPQVQVIERPSNMGVVGPDKTKIKRLFLLSGFILALIIAFIRKIAFERIESANELSKATKLNIVGGVPYVNGLEQEIVVNRLPKAQVTESFRTIRSNLNYLTEVSGTKRILISSFLPSEGKTFCSSNLATILANSDKKVLILDLDLHKPKIHKVFQLKNEVGISSYLTGRAEINDIVQKGSSENLDIITAGPIPPNPSELIHRSGVRQLLEWADQKYDFVLIDTPPFGLLNDAIGLIPLCHVFLVVMNAKFARKRGVLMIENTLAKHGDISIGLVLNGIRESKLKYYYTKYSYKYGYNYGYSNAYGSGYGSGYSEDYTQN